CCCRHPPPRGKRHARAPRRWAHGPRLCRMGGPLPRLLSGPGAIAPQKSLGAYQHRARLCGRAIRRDPRRHRNISRQFRGLQAMSAKRQPWEKWFFSDWRAEPRLKMVSRAARSLWLDMLGLAHDAEPCGFLIVANVPIKDAGPLSRILGDAEAELSALLGEL